MVGDRKLELSGSLTFYYGNEYDVALAAAGNMFPWLLVGSDLCCGPVFGASLLDLVFVSRV
jgi:hypothetical protein